MTEWYNGSLVRWLLLAAAAGVCLAQPAPSLDGTARVVSLEGQVSVMKDSTPWALRVGDSVKPQQMIFTGPDGMVRFEVSDGSTFDVFPNSRFVFRSNPGNWKDLLDMMIGRVKVHIQHWGGQPNHNRVNTPTAVISVRGTIFDVTVEDEDATLVSVDEGEVAVQHKLLPSGEKRLTQGEWLRVYRNQPLAKAGADKGSILSRVLQAMTDAVYTIGSRGPSMGGSPIPGGGPTPGGPTLPGDHGNPPPTQPGGSTTPKPPTAPPAPPAAPPAGH